MFYSIFETVSPGAKKTIRYRHFGRM